VPAGEYFVVALEYVETGQENDPEQLERWRAHATKIILREAETTSLTVTLER
jgi:hypothetical protein